MPETTKPKQEPRLGPTAFAPAEFKRIIYSGIAERGVRPADVLYPSYWAYHAASLKPWDRVEIRAEDGTWYGEYLVLESSRTWAKMFPLRVVMLTPADVAETQAIKANEANAPVLAAVPAADPKTDEDSYQIKFRGPRKWSVIRRSDNAVMAEELGSGKSAKDWLANHLSDKKEPATA